MLTLVQFYLLLYNVVQTFGWSIILWKTLLGLLRNESYQQLYQSCELELQIFQTAAVFEIAHAAASFVRSPLGTTAMQVFSRISLVWLILYKVVSAQVSIGVLFLLVAWSVTEVVRYSYYGLALINAVSSLHTWLRYSFFIVLYPLGVSGELLVILAALPEVSAKKHFTVELPNILNIGFSFWWYLIAYIILYIPEFPQMYTYMLNQRKKILSVEGFLKCTHICLTNEKKSFQWKSAKRIENLLQFKKEVDEIDARIRDPVLLSNLCLPISQSARYFISHCFEEDMGTAFYIMPSECNESRSADIHQHDIRMAKQKLKRYLNTMNATKVFVKDLRSIKKIKENLRAKMPLN